MDDSNEGTNGPLGSTSIFGRIVAGHCDMDSIAMSPSTSEFGPYVYMPLRETTKLINQEPSETSSTDLNNTHYERRNSRRDSLYSPKRRNSNLTTSSFQSFDNLAQIMRENQYGIIGEFDDINHVTQSLPATPLTTPQASPPGSPKTERRNSKNDFNCSLPWYYSGFISANSKPESSSLVCTGDKQTEKPVSQQVRKRSIGLSSECAGKNQFPMSVTNFYREKKYAFTNRDMNFLAPTTL